MTGLVSWIDPVWVMLGAAGTLTGWLAGVELRAYLRVLDWRAESAMAAIAPNPVSRVRADVERSLEQLGRSFLAAQGYHDATPAQARRTGELLAASSIEVARRRNLSGPGAPR